MTESASADPAGNDFLPDPQVGRFKPLRIGLVDMFLYDAQEFRFRDGRLLLRGDNGSGKSKVLALTLPLLLDANLHPSRMEPDGDPNKKMAWNLLLGDEHDERTGYTWVEFGRIDRDTGVAEFVTLGLGVKAVRNRGVVKQWWFITDQRVGEELHLADRTRTVRTQDRLGDAIGDRGEVFDSNGRYRRAVDERLFGLHDRYGALLDLLVSLRQPQLSKRPDAALMDRALTEALSPLDPSLVDTVAQSFQSLEDDEVEVKRLRAEAGAVARFSLAHRRYARIATARAADGPRAANARYEDRTRLLRAAEEHRDAAAASAKRADDAFTDGADTLARLAAERNALIERSASPEFTEFKASGEAVEAAARHLATAVTSADRATRTTIAQRARTAAAAEAMVGREAVYEEDVAEFEATAAQAALVIVPPDASHDADRFRAVVRHETERRAGQVRLIEALSEACDSVRRAVTTATGRVEEAEGDLSLRDSRMRKALSSSEEATDTWLRSIDTYLADLVELRTEGVEPPLQEAAIWALDPQGAHPIEQWVREAHRARVPVFDTEVAHVIARRTGLESRIRELREEQRRLESGSADRPASPRARSSDRSTLAGGAFWELVDLAEGVDPAMVVGLEAALAASGILDAWVAADGSLVAGDTVLVPRPADGRTLASVLVPTAVGSAVDTAMVKAVLESVRLVEEGPVESAPTGASVSLDGWFAVGPLVGSSEATQGAYLGQVSREAARLRRLEEIGAGLEELDDSARRLDLEESTLRERRARLETEVSAVPDDRPFREAVRAAGEATRLRSDAAESLASRSKALAEVCESRDEAELALSDAVALCELPIAALRTVADAVRDLTRLAKDLIRAVQSRDAERVRAEQERAALQDAEEQEVSAEASANDARLAEIAAQGRYEALRSTVGVDVEEVERRLGESRSAVRAEEAQQATRISTKIDAEAELAVCWSRLADATTRRNEAFAERRDAIDVFQGFARTGLIALAVDGVDIPDLAAPWSPDPATRLARRLLGEVGEEARDTDWDAATGALRRAYESLQSELSTHGRQATWEQLTGVAIVRVQLGNERVEPARLEVLLSEELALRERLLSADERNILETHLIDEVGAQLHDRVQAALRQVSRMNDELDARPTRSGLRLRIRWRPEEDEVANAGRKLLQQDSALWSVEAREAIGAFLRARVEAAREENPDGSWFDRLSAAFDYRAWNRFDVQLNQGSGWRPASGPASGGEKVLAASVPLFAAASSHYSTAGVAHAPRLVLLDEAFAGVDDRSRASYLGLLAEFDLDVVMTSEREWATYPEVPGIGIANLFRLPGIDTVHVEHWEWNGVSPQKLTSGRWERSAIESTPAAPHDDSATGLFDIDIDGVG